MIHILVHAEERDGLDLIGFNGFRVEDWIPVSEILLVCCSSNSFSKLQKHSM